MLSGNNNMFVNSILHQTINGYKRVLQDMSSQKYPILASLSF